MPFDFITPKDYFKYYLVFNFSALSVPDEDYSENAPCALYVLLPKSNRVDRKHLTKDWGLFRKYALDHCHMTIAISWSIGKAQS